MKRFPQFFATNQLGRRFHCLAFACCFCVPFFTSQQAWTQTNADDGNSTKQQTSSKPNPRESGNIEESIKQLGSGSFLQREDAAQRLLFLGVEAEAALAAAANEADREVRDRSKRVLKLIREEKRNAWLVQFRNGKATDAVEAALPGWSKFVDRYGDSVESREVYAEILSDDWELVAQCFAGESDVQRQIVLMQNYQLRGRQRIHYRNSAYGTSLALFFLYSEYPRSAGPWLQQYLFDYMRNPQIAQRLQGRNEHPVVRRLVSDWVIAASGPSLNDQNAQRALQNARLYRLERASRVVAERILTDANAIPVMRRNAMESIVVRKDLSQLKLIERFLDDRTILGTSKQRTLQLRDVALACVMHLKGYDVNKIGVRLTANSTIVAFEYQSLGFITDGDRAKAFETYRKLEEQSARSQ